MSSSPRREVKPGVWPCLRYAVAGPVVAPAERSCARLVGRAQRVARPKAGR